MGAKQNWRSLGDHVVEVSVLLVPMGKLRLREGEDLVLGLLAPGLLLSPSSAQTTAP